jgi:hypothetical protein
VDAGGRRAEATRGDAGVGREGRSVGASVGSGVEIAGGGVSTAAVTAGRLEAAEGGKTSAAGAVDRVDGAG